MGKKEFRWTFNFTVWLFAFYWCVNFKVINSAGWFIKLIRNFNELWFGSFMRKLRLRIQMVVQISITGWQILGGPINFIGKSFLNYDINISVRFLSLSCSTIWMTEIQVNKFSALCMWPNAEMRWPARHRIVRINFCLPLLISVYGLI
mgnify:CR=1 FL=1